MLVKMRSTPTEVNAGRLNSASSLFILTTKLSLKETNLGQLKAVRALLYSTVKPEFDLANAGQDHAGKLNSVRLSFRFTAKPFILVSAGKVNSVRALFFSTKTVVTEVSAGNLNSVSWSLLDTS